MTLHTYERFGMPSYLCLACDHGWTPAPDPIEVLQRLNQSVKARR